MQRLSHPIHLFVASLLLVGIGVMSTPVISYAAPRIVDSSGHCTGSTPTGQQDPGVLTRCTQDGFQNYLNAFFHDNLAFIFLIALVMIVFSGVQYMNSGFSPDALKTARQRILGILGGVVFLLIIELLLNQLGGVSGVAFSVNGSASPTISTAP